MYLELDNDDVESPKQRSVHSLIDLIVIFSTFF